jgi:PAS domain S-box-containing protein
MNQWFMAHVNAQKTFKNHVNQFNHKNGSLVILETSGSGIYDSNGSFIGYRGVDRDITDRMKVEDENKKLRNFLQNIIDSMPSILVGVDIQGNVIQWNKEAELKTGIMANEALRKNLVKVFPQFKKRLKKIKTAIKDRKVHEESKILNNVNNEITYEDITVYPLISNGVEGAVIRIDDVTDKVRLEELMIQSEKMLSVGGLAAGMAHEINNPLAAMMQNTAVILRHLVNDLVANDKIAAECGTDMNIIRNYAVKRHIIEQLEMIQESGIRASNIIKNMLNFARKSDSAMEYVNISEVLEKTIELAYNDFDLKKKYDFRKVKIKREYQQDMPRVLCDERKIQQVFLNLIKNSAHAMSEYWQNKDTASDLKSVPTLFLRIFKNKEMAHIEIEDNGPGMSEKNRKHIFEPFFTTKKVGVGTGLGLSISFFIITENHHGSLSVESTEGEGAKFIIEFPL